MLNSTRSHVALVCLVASLTLLACDLGSVAQLVSPTPTQPAPPSRLPMPIAPTPTPGVPAATGATLTLRPPIGQPVTVPVRRCEGLGLNQRLEVMAENTADLNDSNRVHVEIAGNHAGAGAVEKMYVSVILGPISKTVFGGNTTSARVVLEANGSGRFTDVAIVNIGSPPPYDYGKEYKFSAEWTCK